jgi:hypothetical protein
LIEAPCSLSERREIATRDPFIRQEQLAVGGAGVENTQEIRMIQSPEEREVGRDGWGERIRDRRPLECTQRSGADVAREPDRA